MQKLIFTIAASLLVAGTSAANAQAPLISVQFSRDNGATQTGAAVRGASGDYWNDFIGSPAGSGALLTTAGDASGASLSFSSSLAYESTMSFTQFTGTPYANLMQGYLVDFMNSPGIDLTFSGLTAGQSYGFWIYTQGDDNSSGRSISLTANGGPARVATQTNTANFTLDDNYVYLTTFADANGRVEIDGHDLNGEANVNGVQLMAVPEPSSIALLMAGFAFVVGASVRKARTR